MGYLRKRMLQPSTWLGIGTAAVALATGGGFTPAVISALLAAAGLVHVDVPTDRQRVQRRVLGQ